MVLTIIAGSEFCKGDGLTVGAASEQLLNTCKQNKREP
jgi:hypothetical protein